MRYLIILSKWIRNSTQNGESIIDSSNRIKTANGLARHHFFSALDVIARHGGYEDEFDVDEQNLSIALADDYSIYYYESFKVVDTMTFCVCGHLRDLDISGGDHTWTGRCTKCICGHPKALELKAELNDWLHSLSEIEDLDADPA